MDFLKLFKYNSLKYADKIALRYNDKSYTYKELDELSNYVSLLLEKQGIKSGDIVGLMMPRSEYILISILAILKLGCTFLPLDIDFPKERIEYIISDSKINNIITTEKGLFYSNVQTIIIDNIEKISEYNYCISKYPYIIYTSGSTGNPKGVLLKYSGLNNLLDSFIDILKINSNDNFLAITTISFDISIMELLLPLCVGATVIIASSRCQIDPYYLDKTLKKYDITMMQATPVTWQMLIDINWQNETGIKVICGGEALPSKLAKRILENTNDLWNVYGPTETTIWSSFSKITDSNDISIGTPIKNTIFKIYDKDSPSTLGELYIGGMGLAEGYLYNDEMTNNKFVDIDGMKYYKTGDIVKLVDGKYYYVCRSDFQVKINGHRIELGEIENVISLIEDISSNAIIYDKDLNELLCFIIEKRPINDEVIYDYISKKLPSYMFPNKIIRINEFPLTDNKKINRKKLLKDYKSNNINDISINNITSYDIVKMLIELNENYDSHKIEEALPFDNQDVWFMQSYMYKHHLMYPDSINFYEETIIELPYNLKDNSVLNDIKRNLQIFNYSIARHRDKYIFVNKENDLIKLDCYDNKIKLSYHNSVIDGESINILINIIIDGLLSKKVNYELYNNCINEIERLNNKLVIIEPVHNIDNIFTDEKERTLYNKHLTIDAKNIKDYMNLNNNSMSDIIQYVILRSLEKYTNNVMQYGIINSNRNFMNNKLTLGNFINIVHQEYEKKDIKSFNDFMKKSILNKKNYYFKYNVNNIYEILLIINNIQGIEEKLVKNNILLNKGNYIYENNNSPINIKCDIGDIIDIYISAKKVVDIEKIEAFVSDIERNFNNIGALI